MDEVPSPLKVYPVNLNTKLDMVLSVMTLGSPFARLISCSGENAVQGGDPTTQNGLTSRTSLVTLDCTAGLLKSHGCPVAGSSMVRSKLNPGLRVVPRKLRPAITWHSLGCENISTTSGPFRSKSFRAFLRVSSTRMSSTLPKSRFNLSSVTASVSLLSGLYRSTNSTPSC